MNHNGGFDPTSDDVPTEAAVVRSLYRSVEDRPEVINLGFAFVTFGREISCIWDTALSRVGTQTVVVAPAGNQYRDYPRFPAALGATTDWHRAYPNVIGVASSINRQKSRFTNYGPWVKCSANGEKLHSTFLTVYRAPEDGPDVRLNFRGWAEWNGTSFATPRVVAAVANRIVRGVTPLAAWNLLSRGRTRDPDLGFILDDIP
jgi:subtilisin family serine protease